MPKTLVEAQERYIERITSCKTGHRNRVRHSAARGLRAWATNHGYDAGIIHQDAKDVLVLRLFDEG